MGEGTRMCSVRGDGRGGVVCDEQPGDKYVCA